MFNREWIIIRDVASGQVRVCRVIAGYEPRLSSGYLWAGPYRTQYGAEMALKTAEVRRQLYPEGREP